MKVMPDLLFSDPLQLLSVPEVAELFRVKPKTVYSWVAQRKIRYVKINGALRFRRQDLEAMVQPTAALISAENPWEVRRSPPSSISVKEIMAKVRKLTR